MPSTHKDHNVSDPKMFWAKFVLPRIAFTEGISPRDEPGVVTVTRQVLNDELSAMHRAMCSIRTRLNALCPISALPSELLVRIFEFDASMHPAGTYVNRRRRLGWIEVTHVCRHWRDTALQSPSLWSNVCFTLGARWMELMLSRAKSVPISINWNVFKEIKGTQESLNLVSGHLRHTRELALAGPVPILEPFIDALDLSCGILETVKLRLSPRFLPNLANDILELPEAMAGCRLPSLRHLFLQGCWVPWSAPILHNLVQLEIWLSEPLEVAQQGWLHSSQDGLLGALKNMPTIETLVLKDCLPLGPRMNGGGEVVQLPKLKLLRLHGSFAAGFAITKQLQIPASCQVGLTCSDDPFIAEILPFLTAHIHDGAHLPAWHALLVEVTSLHLCFEAWRLCNAFTGDRKPLFPRTNRPLPEPDLAILFYTSERSLLVLKSLCNTLSPQTIRTLDVSTDLRLSSRTWIDILGRFTEIDAASIRGDYTVTFCKALSRATDGRPIADMQASTQDQLFLGKLRLLHISRADFRTIKDRLRNEHILHPWLVQWLSERRHVNIAPTLEINIVACTIKGEWVEKLRNVAAVEWDGLEGNCSRSDDDGSDENAD